MRNAVVLDLTGEPAWEPVARRAGARYLSLAGDAFWTSASSTPILIDCRGRYDEGIQLAERLRQSTGEPRAELVLVTERISAGDHQRAYLAGVDRVLVLNRGEADHAAILDALVARGGR